MQLTGHVVKKPFAVGTKSERLAVMLETVDGHEYVLRRRGGHAFYDEALETLVGQDIRTEGLLRGYTFLIDNWQSLPVREA